MISVQNLSHKYAGNADYSVRKISFDIGKGEIFGFLGPSGAGKSTVQKILTGLLKKQEGHIWIEGTEIDLLNKDFFEKIGVSFELPNLYEKLTGYENLKYYAGLFSKKTFDPLQVLSWVGLENDAHKKASAYSKGMKQRLVFARAVISDPELLFLDEPLSGLDPATALSVKRVISDFKDRGKTIFLTTHNMFLADEICDNVAFLNEGQILAMDTPKKLKLKYGSYSVNVEYRKDKKILTELFFLDKEEEKKRLKEVIDRYEIIIMHSREATLEEIFIKLAGRGLN